MSLSAQIREQLISSFRAELAEHVQTVNDGLLAIEQDRIHGDERQATLEEIFRAGHSLKGAARAVGVTAIEQLAHSLESIFDAMQRDAIKLTPELFTVCYHALDAIQAVQTAYEAGETTPPIQCTQSLAELQAFQAESRTPAVAANEHVQTTQEDEPKPDGSNGESERETAQPAAEAGTPVPERAESQEDVFLGAALHEQLGSVWSAGNNLSALLDEPEDAEPEAAAQHVAETQTVETATPVLAENQPVETVRPGDNGNGSSHALGLDGNGTIRVSVDKLDSLMNQLNELLTTKVRAQQQLTQMRDLQDTCSGGQKEWLQVRGVYKRLSRQEKSGLLSAHRLKSVDALLGGVLGYAGVGDHQATAKLAGPMSGIFSAPTGQQMTMAEDQLGALRELGKDMAQLLRYVDASERRWQKMDSLVTDMSRQYASDATYTGMVIDSLEQEIKRVRMLPLSTITGTFSRMVRDLAHSSGKEAILEITGGDTELDKQVLEQIKDPLLHLLRNAVGHGIETKDVRVKQGKSPTGTITLAAEQTGKNIVIRVSDDGSGLDLESVRESIARRGVLEVETLTEADLKEAIFQAGVSTSPIITDLSGRGVGLDIVRKNIEALRGTVDVSSEPGQGTTFTLTLPLRLASSRGLLVQSAGHTFAVPLNGILKIESYTPQQISSLEGHDTVLYDGQPLTLVRLSDVLELSPVRDPEQSETSEILAIVVAAAERRMAFAVDGLGGEQEMVIKTLGKQLSRVGGIAGATVTGDRKVILVLNVGDLIKLSIRGKRRSLLSTLSAPATMATENAQKQILIVDDSITTRTLEKNILEAAGYDVRLATDGQEALGNISAAGVPDLIVTDVAMPRMNGFELTQHVKEDESTGHVPVILVTSLDSDEDKAQGIAVGADAYIVKSSFDQDNLLETIEQLI